MTASPVVRLACKPMADLTHRATALPTRWLSDAETVRLARLATPQRRAQFLAGRWLARSLLAEAFGGDPVQWALSAPQLGPPRVEAAPVPNAVASVHLSISHSAGQVACAVAPVPIGLDIEVPRPGRDIDALAKLCFTPAECARLQATPTGAERAALFYALWTAKEAWIKCRAHALTPQRLAQIEVQPARAGEQPAIQVWQSDEGTLALACPAAIPLRWHTPAPKARYALQVRDQVTGETFSEA